METAPKKPVILKADGTEDVFDVQKLEESLMLAGAGTHTASRISALVSKNVFPGIRTADIYRRAFALLRKEERAAAARYSLRRALLELGPSGHPFEDFVAKIFAKQGWKVEWRKILQGKCVAHEVDIYGTRSINGTEEVETMAGELKYHNDPAYKTDVKTALYVKARLDDIWHCDPTKEKCPIDRSFLVTNTKFTSQAIAYGTCAGLELISWNYPQKGNLFDLIRETGVYPITALTTLKKSEKKVLIERGIVSCDALQEQRAVLREILFSPERVGDVLAESAGLCASSEEPQDSFHT